MCHPYHWTNGGQRAKTIAKNEDEDEDEDEDKLYRLVPIMEPKAR